MAAVLWMIGLLLSGNREVLLFRGRRDRSKGRADAGEAFLKLFARDDQRHENAYYIAVRPGRNGDQAMFITILRDFFRFLVGGLTRFRATNEFDRTHTAESPNVADDGPLFLPRACALYETLAD